MNTRVTITIPENFPLPAELMLASGFIAGREMDCVFEQGAIHLRARTERQIALAQFTGSIRDLSPNRDAVAELVAERISEG